MVGNADGLRSGWFCYPGKLKHSQLRQAVSQPAKVPDGFAIRGS